MVRHEAAEALGGIGTPEVLPHLKEWKKRDDAPRVVKESCQAAVDMWEDTEDTPIQSSLELTTTGILSNKPPKLGLSATATATTTSSSSNSGINTPAITTTIIPNSLASSSSNLLVAAKKESAKRILYSRFFRGPVLGPDSDEIIKTRTGDLRVGTRT
ncbi:hypothetical protein AGABI1DRAFT_128614 [Agaricus bisporus var. burnettii JB137-S8]|uniref:Uncharacterized protein n=1 Tax=Agaricus bisporus var. burnettii (strain JB137-S8 / ATCC MYA-4627 / FGSC 10392) TaxID=597362 RepID=K5X8W1_AGABU|nr:uncharacterized protein AGABI1DRAFT_128614 [Agaricus bisporus var. burnettii JB137-S8]EKM79462.1 hypothetical protein AGABI1DRAFT_128614 [Agaricus bisporus var. burnettii JB137-S8]